MTRCASAALGCLLIVFCGLPVCSGEDVNGRWEGTLTFRDAVWRIRMEFARDGGALSATLDLPDMVMAWEPLTVVGEEPVVRVQLPFGVGEFELLPADGGIRSTQTFGDDETMTLELVRAGKAPYQREEIFIESAGARLAGTLLLLPRGKDRWPGIVLLHGSGVADRTRWEYRSTVKRFLRADHRLETPMGRDESGHWDWPRIPPGFFTAVDEWLSALVTKPRNESYSFEAGG